MGVIMQVMYFDQIKNSSAWQDYVMLQRLGKFCLPYVMETDTTKPRGEFTRYVSGSVTRYDVNPDFPRHAMREMIIQAMRLYWPNLYDIELWELPRRGGDLRVTALHGSSISLYQRENFLLAQSRG